MSKLKKFCIYLAFAANAAVIVGFWWLISSPLFGDRGAAGTLLALGRLAGLLAVYFALLQFLMLGRAIWLEKVFGLDKLSRVHRLNGFLVIVLIVLHPILVTISYAISDHVSITAQFADFIANYDGVLLAAIAVVLFAAIVCLSIYTVKKHLKYELWYYIHLFTYLAIVLAFGHQIKLGGDLTGSQAFYYYWCAVYIFVFGNVLIFRFIKPAYNSFKFRFVVEKVIQETPDASSVYITGKNLDKFRTRPGQFIIVRFLAKGFRWEAHPFSLSFIPKNNLLRITVKNCGDFTAKMPALKTGTPVCIDGPYGIMTAEPQEKAKYLFVAGGIGITPLRSLIEQLSPNHDVILLYSNKNERDIIFKKELDEMAKNHHFQLHYVISGQPEYAGEKGRIDKEKLQRLVPDILERKVYICGPPAMTETLINLLKSDDVKPQSIHFEKFAL
jgi:predicted ferric reductase